MQTIIVDMTPGFRMPTIHYSQGDVGTQFAIDLRSRFGDSFPTGTTVTIQATKPSGFGFSVAATSVTNGVATFTTTAEMTDEFGRFPAELKVTKTGLTLFTANFYMDGERNTHPEGTTDGSQETVIPELTQLVERVEDAASSVLDMTVVANTLPAGSAATYSYNEEENKVTFGIPEGQAGSGAVGTVASAYSATKTYAVGDYAIQNGNLYRCTTAITTAEAWTSGHWTQVVLGDDVADLKSELKYLTGGEQIAFTKGGYITTSGDTVDINSVTSNAGWMYAVVDCTAGEYFYIHATGGSSPRAYAFADSSSNVLERENSGVETNRIVIAPANAVKLIINKQLNAEAYPSYRGRPLPEWVDAVEDKVDSLDSIVNTDLSHIFGGLNTHIAYNNASKLAGTEGYNISKVYDVADFVGKTLNIKTISQQYYNIYTFLDASENVLSYQRENNNNNKAYDLDLAVPASAKTMILTCGNANLGSVEVRYNERINANDKLNALGLPKELRATFFGYFYTNTTKATESATYIQCARYDVSGVKEVNVKMHSDQYYNIYTFVDANDNVISYSREETSGGRDYDIDLVVPANAKYLFLSSYERYYTYLVVSKFDYCGAVNQWTDKQIVWLGTSIPATAKLGLGRQNSYPMKIARLLGADVYNEAVGSSALHCKSPSRISSDNPYGFLSNFEAVSRCLTNTIEEMQWIIEHYNSSIFTEQTVGSMTQELEDYILSCSYQNKIDKYFANGNKPSLWVLDHGHNDWPTQQTESYYENDHYSLYSFKGAMNFIIRYILEKDPFARIVIIGEYSNKYQPMLVECQEFIANLWNLPLYKQWNYTGFTNMEIETNGYYDKGIWQESGGTTQSIDMKDVWIPDGIHPSFDRTGRTIMMMATNIAGWLRTVGNW